MTPRSADPEIRTALIEAAARLLVDEGASGLTTRRLAAEVGTSTMAVYTYFKGMDELKGAVRREGFARLAQHLDAVPQTRDSVADVAALGVAYFLNALTNSHLYRFMFIEHVGPDGTDVGRSTFERLIAAVARAIDAGRFHGDAEFLATQLWAMAHGIVTLHLAGLLTLAEAIECFADMGYNLFVAFGDDARAARRSVERCSSALPDERRRAPARLHLPLDHGPPSPARPGPRDGPLL